VVVHEVALVEDNGEMGGLRIRLVYFGFRKGLCMEILRIHKRDPKRFREIFSADDLVIFNNEHKFRCPCSLR
jgi:hypothetical protein